MSDWLAQVVPFAGMEKNLEIDQDQLEGSCNITLNERYLSAAAQYVQLVYASYTLIYLDGYIQKAADVGTPPPTNTLRLLLLHPLILFPSKHL